MLRDKTDFALYFSVFLLMIGIGMMVPLLPQRILELTGDVSQVGYLASAFAISYIILQVPFGVLADRHGFKSLLVMGYTLCALTGVVYFISENANVIFLGRMLQGVAEVPIWALAPALLSLRHPLSRGRVMGLYNAVFHLGLTIGPLLGLWIAHRIEARSIFLLYAALCLCGMMVIVIWVQSIAKPTSQTEKTQRTALRWQDLVNLLRRPSSAVMFIGITLYGAGYGISLTSIPAFLITERGMDDSVQRLYFTLVYVALSLSQFVVGGLSDRFKRTPFMIAGMALAAVGLILVPGGAGRVTLIWLTLASFGFGIFHVTSMAQLNQTTADLLKGTISGAYYLFWGVGYFFGPLLFGQISQVRFTPAFYGFALLLALEMLLLMRVKP